VSLALDARIILGLHRVRAFHCFPLFFALLSPLIAIVIAIDPIVLALAGFSSLVQCLPL